MRRRNKCVNKKAYSYRSAAIQVAKTAYEKRGQKLALYTCPICLEFHLTSKYINLDKYYSRWDKKAAYNNRQKEKAIDREWAKKTWKQICLLETQMLNRERNKLRSEKKIKISGTKKENTLPLARQREILAQLNNKVARKSNPQSGNFWTRFWSIIKGEGEQTAYR